MSILAGSLSLDVILLFLMVLVAIAVVSAKDLIISTILLGIFSLLMAAEYLVLGAPDVAFTEAAVGAGISTILLLLALFLVGDKEKRTKGNFIIPIVVVGFVGAILIYTTFDMPLFGSKSAPAQKHIAAYYLENTVSDTGIPSSVTAILASYRGYDTLGETIVILTAAFVVMLLLGRFDKKGDDENG